MRDVSYPVFKGRNNKKSILRDSQTEFQNEESDDVIRIKKDQGAIIGETREESFPKLRS